MPSQSQGASAPNAVEASAAGGADPDVEVRASLTSPAWESNDSSQESRPPEVVSILLWSTNVKWTDACLRQLTECTHPPAEVILVPEVALHGTPAVMRRFRSALEEIAADHQTDWVPVRVSRHVAGVYDVHQALSEICTDVVAVVRDDVLVTPDWLTPLVAACGGERETTVVSPLTTRTYVRTANPRDPLPSSASELARFAGAFQLGAHVTFYPADPTDVSCLVFRRAVLGTVGTLDSALHSHETAWWDWISRARAMGYEYQLRTDVYVHTIERAAPESPCEVSSWERLRRKWHISANADVIREIQDAFALLHPGMTGKDLVIPVEAAVSPPLLTVVVVHTTGDTNQLRQLIEYLQKQPYRHWETIVVTTEVAENGITSVDIPPLRLWVHALDTDALPSVVSAVKALGRGTLAVVLNTANQYEAFHLADAVDQMQHWKGADRG